MNAVAFINLPRHKRAAPNSGFEAPFDSLIELLTIRIQRARQSQQVIWINKILAAEPKRSRTPLIFGRSELRQDAEIFEGRGIAFDGFSCGNLLEQATHDLSGTRFG